MTHDDIAEIREAAKSIVRWSDEVETEKIAKRILRLLDEAEKDTATIYRLPIIEDGEQTSWSAWTCDKCGTKQPDKYPFCPGCGRRIERGSGHE